MGKRKGRKRKADDESDDDTGPVNRAAGRKKKGLMLESGSEEEQNTAGEKNLNMEKRLKNEATRADPGSGRKGKILRCADSSEEEVVTAGATPKVERMKKLEEMRSRLSAKKAKKKVRYSSSSEASDDEGPGDEEDEENLPMWENEEAPPENAKVFVEDPEEKDDSDLEGFVVSDGNEEADAKAGRLPDSEEDETKKAASSKKRVSGRRKGNLGNLNLHDSDQDESAGAASSKSAAKGKRPSVQKRKTSRESKRTTKVRALISDTEDRSSSSEESE